MPTTIEYWSVDGTSLNELGWNVSTLGGRFNVPPLRGDDAQFAYVEGDDFRPKTSGARVLSLAMWMQATDPATGGMDANPMARWNDNWNTLCRLFWTPRRELTLTRRWLRTDPLTGTIGIQTTSATAQYVGGLEPSMNGRYNAVFTVDLKLADPFFYGAEQTAAFALDEEVTVTNPGDHTAAGRHMYLDFIGPLHYPVLTNSTPAPDVTVTYNGIIPSGQTISLDVRAFTATAAVDEIVDPAAPLTRVRTGYVRHSGTRPWMGLERGPNNLTLTADSGTGSAELRFRAPYL